MLQPEQQSREPVERFALTVAQRVVVQAVALERQTADRVWRVVARQASDTTK